jgi:hypothetical protein
MRGWIWPLIMIGGTAWAGFSIGHTMGMIAQSKIEICRQWSGFPDKRGAPVFCAEIWGEEKRQTICGDGEDPLSRIIRPRPYPLNGESMVP